MFVIVCILTWSPRPVWFGSVGWWFSCLVILHFVHFHLMSFEFTFIHLSTILFLSSFILGFCFVLFVCWCSMGGNTHATLVLAFGSIWFCLCDRAWVRFVLMCAHWLTACPVLVSANGIAACMWSCGSLVGAAQYKCSLSSVHTQFLYTAIYLHNLDDWGLGDQVLS